MATGVLAGSAVADVEACQLACKTDTACQYFAFYTYNVDGTNNCFLRSAAAALAKVTFDVKAPSTNFAIMFEVKAGIYAAYVAKDAADAAGAGTTIDATLTTFDAAKTACDANAACVGFANTAASVWRTFSAAKWEGAVGKVRAFGPALNSWVAEPTL
jgi:hypothetical protein